MFDEFFSKTLIDIKTNIKMDYVAAILIFIVVYYIYLRPLTPIGIQGDTFRTWNVVGAYDNHKEAAAAFSRLNVKMIKLGRHLRTKYHIGETDDVIAAEGANHVAGGEARNLAYYYLRDYNPDVLYENDNKFTSDTSYNLSKGEAIYMCMRKKHDPNSLETDNLLMFVLLHEVSHTILKTNWGHETDFWTTFKWLLGEAVEAGVYEVQDFAREPENFCGLEITYQPLLDPKLLEIK
jgi:hypothetical protein